MKLKLTLALVAGCLALHGLHGAETDGAAAEWMTDPAAALAKAERENKSVLMNFTGSDWCPWCKKLDAEVFSQPEFASYAQQHLVLLKVDFPRRKSQSAAERKQNEKLAQQYGIEAFPTIVLADPNGKERGRLGYQPGGPEAWLAELEALR